MSHQAKLGFVRVRDEEPVPVRCELIVDDSESESAHMKASRKGLLHSGRRHSHEPIQLRSSRVRGESGGLNSSSISPSWLLCLRMKSGTKTQVHSQAAYWQTKEPW